jgi:hypothetical protein
MILDYVPLLEVQRDLHGLPRNYERFKQYLRTIFQEDELGMRLPLLAMNPMGREHATALLDGLLAVNADGVAAEAIAEAAPQLADIPGEFKLSLVIVDDAKGGWTNRFGHEFDFRFGLHPDHAMRASHAGLPRWLKHYWLFGVLWTSEPAGAQAAREAILCALYRAAYVQNHGPARTLRERLAQEGQVMAQAGCRRPVVDDDEAEYTREVLRPFLDADDMRTTVECLFGDDAARTLGFTPRGLSSWAGIALALADARVPGRIAGGRLNSGDHHDCRRVSPTCAESSGSGRERPHGPSRLSRARQDLRHARSS